MTTQPQVELLYFDGCPNWRRAVELLEETAAELNIQPEIELTKITSPADAQKRGFLGSPSVRVNGRDIEPRADKRRDHSLACRVYRTDDHHGGLPPKEWVAQALRQLRDG